MIALVTIERQVVLEPFCGCRTTLVAVKNLNGEYIGFEINDKYFQNIKKDWKMADKDMIPSVLLHSNKLDIVA